MSKFKRVMKVVGLVCLLLVVVYISLGFVAKRSVDKEIAKIKANGDPVSCTELAEKLIPYDENGAIIYGKVFKHLDRLFEPESAVSYDDILSPKFCIDPEAWKRAREAVKKSDDIYRLVGEAAAKSRCRFKVNWKDGIDASFPYNLQIRNLSRFLATRAMVEAKDGNVDASLESVNMIYKLGDSIKNDPVLISLLVRLATLETANNTLASIANEMPLDKGHIADLMSQMTKVDLNREYLLALKGERVLFIDTVDKIKKDGFACVLADDVWHPLLYTRQSYWGRPLLYRDEADSLKYFNKLITITANVPYRNMKAETQYYSDSVLDCWRINILQRFFLSHYSRFRASVDRGQSQLNGGQILLALCVYKKQFGSYPNTLTQLQNKIGFKVPTQDPFSGKDFMYKRQGKGFILYSVGLNLHDEGGINKMSNDPNQYDDIVWKMSH